MTGKRRPALDLRQIGFTFDAPVIPQHAADLAGLERQVSSAVSHALKGEARSRDEVAGALSALLDDPVSRFMLDAYSSESREGHAMSAARFFGLIAVTKRFDLLDALLRRIGASLLVGAEIHTAKIGHIEQQISALSAELKALKTQAPLLLREQR